MIRKQSIIKDPVSKKLVYVKRVDDIDLHVVEIYPDDSSYPADIASKEYIISTIDWNPHDHIPNKLKYNDIKECPYCEDDNFEIYDDDLLGFSIECKSRNCGVRFPSKETEHDAVKSVLYTQLALTMIEKEWDLLI